MENPLFSIITICYNSGKVIENTIKSILNQSFTDYEYIIVDGASTDNTLDVLYSYEAYFHGRMKIKSEPDGGIYNAFNKGISRAIGKYIWFVNSDDYIEDDALSNIANFINKMNLEDEVLVGGLNIVDSSGTCISTISITGDSISMSYHSGRMIPHPATLVPKVVYERFGIFDETFRVAGDIDWFYRVYKHVRFKAMNLIITNMRNDGISASNNYRRAASERWRIFGRKHEYVLVRIYRFIVWSLRYFKKWLSLKLKR